MTTLPQTTPIRMPRPASSGAIVGGAGVSAPMYAPPATTSGLSLADAWRVIRGHAWLIVVMACLSAVIGFFVNQQLARYHSRYTAIGQIQFQPTNNYDPIHNPTPTIDPTSLALELATQAQMLKQDSLLTKVLSDANSEIRKTSWFQKFPNYNAAKFDLNEQFSVTPLLGTRLITVAVTTPNPRDSRTILECVVQQHIDDQRDAAQTRQLERTMMLNKRRNDLQNKLREVKTSMNEKLVRLNAGGWDISAGNVDKHQQEAVLTSKATELQGEIVSEQAKLDSTLAEIKRGEDPSEVTVALDSDPTVLYWKNQVDAYNMELALSPQGDANSAHQQLVARRDYNIKQLESVRGEKKSTMIDLLVSSLKSGIASRQQQLDGMAHDLDTVKQEVADLSNVYRQWLAARDDDAELRADLKEVVSSIDQSSEVAAYDNGGVNWSTRPTIPDVPSFPKLTATMTLSIMMGVGIALSIAFLRELTDTTVRSPRDISRLGQLNLLGMVSDINDDAQSSGAKLPLVIFEAPHAILAEQFRQVRTRMQHSASLDSTRSILITSPGPGDGKSTVACNLAAGLALNGRRILLVDANFRRPELHKIFNLTNDTGFSDVLNQLDTLPQNIRESQVPNLAVLTSGAKPVNATELFESQLLVDFIEKALEEFDHVVFDSGPLLVVSETVALAPRVDGVVTVVRARHNSRGLLVRMRDTLKQLKAEHLGVILNGVRAQGGGYYGRNIKTYYAYQADGAAAPETVVTSPTSAA